MNEQPTPAESDFNKSEQKEETTVPIAVKPANQPSTQQQPKSIAVCRDFSSIPAHHGSF